MIKQLFKSNVLGNALLAALMLIAVCGLNQISAQTQHTMSSGAVQAISPDDFQDFKSNMKGLQEDAETNPRYSELERAIRLTYYRNVINQVERGKTVSEAIYSAVEPTRVDIQRFRNPASVNLEAIVEETQNQLL